MTGISADEAYRLVQEVGTTGAELIGETTILFTLKDGRKLTYSIEGFSEGCSSCGWGSEAIIHASIETPDV